MRLRRVTATAKPVPKERDIQKAIVTRLSFIDGVMVERMNTGAFGGEYKGQKRFVRFGTPGSPDIRCTVRHPTASVGVSVALEVKRPGGKQSPEQVAWQKRFEAVGGIYAVVRSTDEALAVVMPVVNGEPKRAGDSK